MKLQLPPTLTPENKNTVEHQKPSVCELLPHITKKTQSMDALLSRLGGGILVSFALILSVVVSFLTHTSEPRSGEPTAPQNLQATTPFEANATLMQSEVAQNLRLSLQHSLSSKSPIHLQFIEPTPEQDGFLRVTPDQEERWSLFIHIAPDGMIKLMSLKVNILDEPHSEPHLVEAFRLYEILVSSQKTTIHQYSQHVYQPSQPNAETRNALRSLPENQLAHDFPDFFVQLPILREQIQALVALNRQGSTPAN